MTNRPPIDDAALQAMCEVLAATDGGLTNKEINQLLAEAEIPDPTPAARPGTWVMVNKRDRLYASLRAYRQAIGHDGGALRFIQLAMRPARYSKTPEVFADRRRELNVALSFAGLQVEENGDLVKGRAATTVTEARRRAQRLRQQLGERRAHHRVLAGCAEEIRDDNYFHAVLEAAKSLAEEIRRLTDLTLDGYELIDAAFEKGKHAAPLLALNTLETETERSRHRGLANGLRAIFSAARNPAAHEAKVLGRIDEQDALDHLTQISYLHRRIDECTLTAHRRQTS